MDGAGIATTVISGGGADRVFDASTADGLSMSGVRITGGRSTGASGGAILVNADTTLRNVTLQTNNSGQNVISQKPSAKTKLAKGAKVNLVVSRGRQYRSS